jgi:hypothetical protein
MASMNSKRAAAVAILTASLTMIGGAAFASVPSSPGEGYAVVVNAVNDANNTHQPASAQPASEFGLLGEAYAVAVNAVNDANNTHQPASAEPAGLPLGGAYAVVINAINDFNNTHQPASPGDVYGAAVRALSDTTR